jgi:hypothetical protein
MIIKKNNKYFYRFPKSIQEISYTDICDIAYKIKKRKDSDDYDAMVKWTSEIPEDIKWSSNSELIVRCNNCYSVERWRLTTIEEWQYCSVNCLCDFR